MSEKSLLPLKVALFLRLHEVELAETLWKSLDLFDTDENETSFKDPYLLLIQDLVWAHFDRAVCAHMRGDTVSRLQVRVFCLNFRKQWT